MYALSWCSSMLYLCQSINHRAHIHRGLWGPPWPLCPSIHNSRVHQNSDVCKLWCSLCSPFSLIPWRIFTWKPEIAGTLGVSKSITQHNAVWHMGVSHASHNVISSRCNMKCLHVNIKPHINLSDTLDSDELHCNYIYISAPRKKTLSTS